jgi:hypothetical protein
VGEALCDEEVDEVLPVIYNAIVDKCYILFDLMVHY